MRVNYVHVWSHQSLNPHWKLQISELIPPPYSSFFDSLFFFTAAGSWNKPIGLKITIIACLRRDIQSPSPPIYSLVGLGFVVPGVRLMLKDTERETERIGCIAKDYFRC